LKRLAVAVVVTLARTGSQEIIHLCQQLSAATVGLAAAVALMQKS
jgi:hypothetical protein